MYRKILVGLDGSVGSQKALAAAITLAKEFQAELISISVKERLPHYAATVGEVMEEKEEVDKYFTRISGEAKLQAQRHDVDLQSVILPGHEVETIIQFAQEKQVDLLVVGFMGHSRVFGRIWGGTSQNLTKTAPCSVLVVK
jgi:nucleotide-binding universal stress UspA family protein